MKKLFRDVILFLPILLVFHSIMSSERIKQNWYMKVAVGDDGGPCKKAKAVVVIRNENEKLVAKMPVLLKPEFFGIRISRNVVTFPNVGDYTVEAVLRGCDGASRTTKRIPINIRELEESWAVFLVGKGVPDSWRFEYFGITKKRYGDDILIISDFHGPTLKNISPHYLRPCRTSLGAQIQVLELINKKWEKGEQYEFPETVEILEPGESVILTHPPVIMVRGKKKDEPKPVKFTMEIKLLPFESSFQHLIDVQGSDREGPYPTECDVYYLGYGNKSPNPNEGK